VARRVRYHAQFQTDLRIQLRWLSEHRDHAFIQRLRAGLKDAATLLATLPGVGSIEHIEGSVVLRRFILRKLPYVLWFVGDAGDPGADLWLIRLFHVRQDRATLLASALEMAADSMARSTAPAAVAPRRHPRRSSR
jgi:plasmid stabilization system protein ParE